MSSVVRAEHGIRYELDGHVARVTIDRPHVLNAVDRAAHDRLRRTWEEIEASPDVRVVVLTGAGERAFCTGADVSTAGVAKTGWEYWADLDPDGFGALSLRETLDVPVIARVNGWALGGGMEMVLGCDLVVAADTARFGLTEPRIGRLPLDGGMVRLPRQVPYHQAMGLLLTGRKVPAAELYRMGLVTEVVPAAELDDAVQRWVDDVLACAPLSLKAIKQTVQRTQHLTAREANTVRLPALVAALHSKDQDEGVRAFQEKRAPVWSGS
ncbi:enoyl-CoA hydratase-related protein [Geodermatophilus sp. SYSU D00697]